jgi:3D (Asp-Asp-Asp) domain-containing protein
MQATAYLPTDGDGKCITATGVRARHGVVAVDPRVIPLGSRVYIPGYGVALAADTGGAIKGNKIDIYLDSHSECLQRGRHAETVYIKIAP